jgi:hypothetical protein
MADITLNWGSCEGDKWCSFSKLNLDHNVFDELFGVYIIWRFNAQNVPQAVRLGQGIVRDRLKSHRQNKDITTYDVNGSTLYVTWAEVDGRRVDGVEAYLARVLNPLVGERFPNRTENSVNLPW